MITIHIISYTPDLNRAVVNASPVNVSISRDVGFVGSLDKRVSKSAEQTRLDRVERDGKKEVCDGTKDSHTRITVINSARMIRIDRICLILLQVKIQLDIIPIMYPLITNTVWLYIYTIYTVYTYRRVYIPSPV